MSNLIQMLGLDGQVIPTRNVKDLSLLAELVVCIESTGGYVSYGARQSVSGSSYGHSIEFLIVDARGHVFLSDYNRNSMTYTEFRKKYKNLPQFLEQWKKHKEANG